MEHLRVELCTEYRLCFRDIISRIFYCLSRSYSACAFWQLSDAIAVRHPDLGQWIKPLEERTSRVDILQLLASIFSGSGTLHLAAIHITDQLRAIANTQNRQATANAAQVHMKRILLIDAQWRSAQDNTYHIAVILRILVVGKNLAEGVQLANAASNELRGLTSEIQYNDFLHRCLIGLVL